MSQNTNNNDTDSLMHNGNELDDNNLSMATPDQQKGTQVHGSIYDDDMVEKFVNNEGKLRWKCKWCNTEYSGWNATKVIRHLNKITGLDIHPC
jgi:hypothetical protein